MTVTASILVVLLDADDAKHVFQAWPDNICLAACLARDGDCSMVVFHRSERAVTPQRLLQVLDTVGDEVCFVPQVHGFATRHFLYSDERRLMALVASDPDLLDEAIDYSVNYTYALEEGLDPAVMLGLQPAKINVSRQPVTSSMASQARVEPEPLARRELSPLLPEFLRKSAARTRRPKFASVRRVKIGMLVPQI